MLSARTRVLLLESDPAHERVAIVALRALGARDIEVARDALEALDHLVRDGPDGRAELLLLELGPRVGAGLEVLTAIRDDPTIATLPAVVLSTSEEQEHLVAACFGAGYPCVRKPVDAVRLGAAIEAAFRRRILEPRAAAARDRGV